MLNLAHICVYVCHFTYFYYQLSVIVHVFYRYDEQRFSL